MLEVNWGDSSGSTESIPLPDEYLRVFEPKKSQITEDDTASLNMVGRSYYLHCLESALEQVLQARMLVKGDVTDRNHELSTIERLLSEALAVS